MIFDIRYSLRMLANTPVFTIIAALTLAVGIGSATVIFSAVNALFLKPLPCIQQLERMVFFTQTDTRRGNDTLGVNYPDFLELKSRMTTMEGLWAYHDLSVMLEGAKEPERVLGTEISPDAFAQMGVQPLLGRNFLPTENLPEQPRVALLSHGLWQRKFGGSPEVIGSTITINAESTTVIGVMPKEWGYPHSSEIWTPLRPDPAKLSERGVYVFRGHGKIKPGVTVEQVEVEARAVMASLAAHYKETNATIGIRFRSLRDEAFADSAESTKLLFGAVLFVFLIACLNVANLLLARGASRSKEIAVRLALGAKRSQLVRQFLVESLILGVLGGVGGFVLAMWGVDLMMAAIPVRIPFWLRFEMDGSVFGFIGILSFVSAAIFGLLPAFKATKPCLVNQLKEGGRSSEDTGVANVRLRNTLVVVEVAISLVLLVGATLLLRSFVNLRNVDPGFARDKVLTLRTGFPPDMVRKDDDRPVTFVHDVETRMSMLPGVISVGATSNYMEMCNEELKSIVMEDGPEPLSYSGAPIGAIESVTPGYFHTLKIPLIAGRWLADTDTASSVQVALVDLSFAQTFFGGPSAALGKRFRSIEANLKDESLVQIVGVVGNVVFKPDAKLRYPVFYRPHTQKKSNFMTVMMRTEGDPLSYFAAARAEVLAVNDRLPPYHLFTLDDVLLKQVWHHRFFSYLFAVSGAIALFLACIGIYGVMTYNVGQRQQELGMRMALGAQPREVIQMVLRQGVTLVSIGLCLGLFGAFLSVPALAQMLYGISPYDPPTFAFVPVLLTAVALLACYLPSRRITRIDPNAALRYE